MNTQKNGLEKHPVTKLYVWVGIPVFLAASIFLATRGVEKQKDEMATKQTTTNVSFTISPKSDFGFSGKK